jgi:F0F1-type ATP synthase membrane subunit b/b'
MKWKQNERLATAAAADTETPRAKAEEALRDQASHYALKAMENIWISSLVAEDIWKALLCTTSNVRLFLSFHMLH